MADCILGPYPPPRGGVALVAKEEFERERGIFIGTSAEDYFGENIYLIKKRRFWNDAPRLLGRLWREKSRISVIHAHYATTFGFVAFLAKWLMRKKYTVTCHGSDVLVNLKRWPHRWFTRRALHWAKEIYAVSTELKRVLNEEGFNKVSVVEHPIDMKAFKNHQTRKKNQLIFVGSVIPLKGVDVLVDAFIQIQKEFPKYRVKIVGQTPDLKYVEKMKQKIKDARIQDRVEFTGERDDLPGLLSESKLFVFPSRVEGHGRALREAIACGLPAVASYTGGIPEIAAKSKNVMLVEPDNVDELAKALEKVLNTLK